MNTFNKSKLTKTVVISKIHTTTEKGVIGGELTRKQFNYLYRQPKYSIKPIYKKLAKKVAIRNSHTTTNQGTIARELIKTSTCKEILQVQFPIRKPHPTPTKDSANE